jgi:ABC-type multidrug transport system ATPase subunit
MHIELREVTKRYGRTRALDAVSLTFEPGEIVAVVGANGAGKTTLLRCLATLAAPDRGEVRCDQEPLQRERLDLRRRIFFLPDFPVVFEAWDPLQHAGMLLRLYGLEAAAREEMYLARLRDLDLLALARRPFATLSRGQRYKAALAALFAVDAELWLLDEPFASGMDPHGIHAFKQQAREAATRGRTVLFTTQLLDVAERFADRICVLQRGQVRVFSRVAELRQQTTTEGNPLEEIFRQLRSEDE